MMPSLLTATIIWTADSRALSISAMAACSAQKPRLQAVSTHTPVKTRESAVRSAAATSPEIQSVLGMKGRASDAAMSMSTCFSIQEAYQVHQ